MKKFKRISVVMAAIACMVFASVFIAKDVNAAQKAPKFAKSEIDVFLVNDNSKNYFYSVILLNLEDNAVVKNVKSSNTDVFEAEYFKGVNDYIKIEPKKTGKAVVSCSVKQNGKTYNLKKTIRVYQGNAFKNIKVNNKQIYQNGRNCVNFYTPKKSVKVSFKLKSGWKIKRMFYNYHNYKGKLMSKNYKMKNGDKIKIGKGSHTSVKIDAVNKKGQVFRFLIMLYNNGTNDYFLAPAAKDNILLDGSVSNK